MSLLVIDKPCGPSSFTVVKRVRALLGKKRREKVGHGGTLDPFASGVLPICIGEGTKILAFLLDADKSYEAVVRFGVETDTLDVTGHILAQHSVGDLSASAIEDALGFFRGPIEQVPPMYSALKRDGRPLYSYARAGETVERAARKLTIHALEMVAFEAPDRARLRVRCSKGTYIRSLAADLGTRLGVGAHLVELRRTASGPFRLEQAITLDELAACVADGRPLPSLSLLEALAHLPTAEVDEAQALVLARGQRMDWATLTAGHDLVGPACAVRRGEGGASLVAVVTQNPDGTVKILRGFGG
ncbi:MAG TPA: tRNA pseudouridine(55) synthase TruB [Polyangia bacterium]